MPKGSTYQTPDYETIEEEGELVYLSVNVGMQFPSQAEAQAIGATAEQVESAVAGAFLVPFFTQFFLKSILNKSWPMINQLQLISLLVLILDSVPINVTTLNEAYLGIINFSVIPKPPVKEAIEKMPSDPVGDFLGLFIDDGVQVSQEEREQTRAWDDARLLSSTEPETEADTQTET